MPSELSDRGIWTMIDTGCTVWSPSRSIADTYFYSAHESMDCFINNCPEKYSGIIVSSISYFYF